MKKPELDFIQPPSRLSTVYTTEDILIQENGKRIPARTCVRAVRSTSEMTESYYLYPAKDDEPWWCPKIEFAGIYVDKSSITTEKPEPPRKKKLTLRARSK